MFSSLIQVSESMAEMKRETRLPCCPFLMDRVRLPRFLEQRQKRETSLTAAAVPNLLKRNTSHLISFE